MKFQRYSDKCFAVISDGPEETYLAGTALGRVVYPGLLILLKGTLGMGKTKLAQGMLSLSAAATKPLKKACTLLNLLPE